MLHSMTRSTIRERLAPYLERLGDAEDREARLLAPLYQELERELEALRARWHDVAREATWTLARFEDGARPESSTVVSAALAIEQIRERVASLVTMITRIEEAFAGDA